MFVSPSVDSCRVVVPHCVGTAGVVLWFKISPNGELTQIMYEINYGRQMPYELQLQNLHMIQPHVVAQVK
jgi:hypothetical protein